MVVKSALLLLVVTAKTTMSVPWTEGDDEDFSELHEALRSGRTQGFSAADPSETRSEVPEGEGFTDSEDDDEVEVEPSPDDHGEVAFGGCVRLLFD